MLGKQQGCSSNRDVRQATGMLGNRDVRQATGMLGKQQGC